MNPSVTSMPSSHEPWLVLLSFAIAVTASYVALELAGRVRAPSRSISLGWLAGGSVAMGTGIWAMHFIGLLAYELPVGVGYRPGPIGWSWLAAVVVSALALQVARQPRLLPGTLLTAACAMAAGICGMHYIGMLSLEFAPGVQWRRTWVGASVLVALVASAVALLLFFHVRALPAARRRPQQVGASLLMAGAIGGMHYLGMAAMDVPAGALCLSAGQLHGEGLAMLVGCAALLLLALTLGTALLDERLQARTSHLSRSLSLAHDNLRHAELHDALTGLPNRLQFDERLAALGPEAEAAEQAPAPLRVVAALLFLDLDGLKTINEAYGHGAGDGVLCRVAERLRAQSRSTDLVARLGADEFVLLLTGVADAVAVRQVADRVLAQLRQPVSLGSGSARINGSIGIALMPQDGVGDRLLLAAKTAMGAAKSSGGGQAVFFAPHMEADAREALQLQADLRRALESPGSGELMLHYQPKVRAADGCVCGAEALLRWRHPQRGMVSPVQFIPVAERSGLIVPLGAWVIDEACRQLAEWRDRGLRLEVAVNLSMHQLRQGGLVEHVCAALQRHGLAAAQLMFEITESAAMSDTDATLRAFDELAALGTKLAIDDFGTGYSSLVWLRKLPSRQLKIDRSFVMDLDSCNDAHAIVQAVVQLAHALGLEVVAEGVETPRQRDLLRGLHCDQLQGYLFARPVPGEQLMRWAMGIDRPVQLQFDGHALGALPAAAV